MGLTDSGPRRRTGMRMLVTAASAALLCALCACSNAASTPGSAEAGGKFTIAFVPKQLNNPYITVELSGGQQAAALVGATASIVGPDTASPTSQLSFITTLTKKRVKVIAIEANDPNAVCSALNTARDAGVKVITFDSDAAASCRSLFVNQVSSRSVALVELKQLGEQIDYTGDFAILSATAHATNQNAWIMHMKDALASDPKYSKMKLVTTVYGDDDDTASFKAAQGLLHDHPRLKGIIAPTTVGIAAAARYLDGSAYKGKVALVGLGLPNQMRAYVRDGTVKEFALWDPSTIGRATVYAAKALVDGTITGKVGDSFAAGSLGTLRVGADNTVIVGPPIEFTSANIDKYNF